MENVLLHTAARGTPVILGSDWHTDVDDAVAIRILAWAHRHGVIRLLGISIDSAMEYSVSSLRAFLAHEGISEVAVGLDHDAFDYGGDAKYHARLAAGRDAAAENASCEEALHLYRRLLAEATERVDIIEVGFSQVLAALLTSEPDELSPLHGRELVAEKVGRLWIMGGHWGMARGREFNFSKTAKASRSIATVLSCWPSPITLVGFEVGRDVKSGGILKDTYPHDALYLALCDYGVPCGRSSWDPMTAYLACVGDEAAAGYDTVSGVASVDPETGYNTFSPTADGSHCYVVKRLPDAEYVSMLDGVLLQQAKEIYGE